MKAAGGIVDARDWGHAIDYGDDLEILARLRPIDDDFMRCLFRDNLPLAQDVLRTITGVADLTLTHMETQHDLRLMGRSRSVVLDVWGVDAAGTVYDLEVQRSDVGASPRRARYHSAAMDATTLLAGGGFGELPESYVVFVTEHDVFGDDAGVYRFERLERGSGRPLGDGTHVLYANGAYRGEDELGSLMRDFCESDPDRMANELLASRAGWLKRDPEGVGQMCELIEEMRRQERERGIEQGMAESLATMMETLKLSAQQAMDALRIPEADRARYLAML